MMQVSNLHLTMQVSQLQAVTVKAETKPNFNFSVHELLADEFQRVHDQRYKPKGKTRWIVGSAAVVLLLRMKPEERAALFEEVAETWQNTGKMRKLIEAARKVAGEVREPIIHEEGVQRPTPTRESSRLPADPHENTQGQVRPGRRRK